MATLSRNALYHAFSDGERPSGNDFRDLIDSAINKVDDGIRRDKNSNLNLLKGLTVGNTTTGQKGTLRLNDGNLEIFDADEDSWNTVLVLDKSGNLKIEENLTVMGSAYKSKDGNWENIEGLPSDARLKRDVKSLDLGLAEICKLDPVYYRYNGKGGTIDDGKVHIGLIAQEIGDILPDVVSKAAVTGSDDGEEYLAYDPSCLPFIMINAIRELSQKVERLEAQLAAVPK